MPKAEGGRVESEVALQIVGSGYISFFILYFFCLFLFCFLHVRAALLGVIKITRLQRGCTRDRRERNVYAANTFHVNTVRSWSWSCLPQEGNSFLVLLSWGRGFLPDEVTTNVANFAIVSFLVAVSPSCLWLATPTALVFSTDNQRQFSEWQSQCANVRKFIRPRGA